MKSTKNVLIAGIVLAIALFASIQMTAMERKVNPYLTKFQKDRIEFMIKGINLDLDRPSCDPKTSNVSQEAKNKCKLLSRQRTLLESIYYDNKAYTNEEIGAIVG